MLATSNPLRFTAACSYRRAACSYIACSPRLQVNSRHASRQIHHAQRRASPASAAAQGATTAAVDGTAGVPKNDVTIVTVGWLGAKERPFSKYSQLWQSLGYENVVSIRPPMPSIMFPTYGQHVAGKHAQQLAQQLKEQQPRGLDDQQQQQRLIVHLFSGGGYIFLAWLLQQLQRQGSGGVIGSIQGIILDSSPALVVPDVASRAMVSAALGEPAEGVQERHPGLVKATAAAVGLYLRLQHIDRDMQQVHATWRQLVPPCPKLFLYSDADVLVDPTVIDGFMKEQAARGSDVRSKRWHDSAHVDHWRAHPEEYAEQLRVFAGRVGSKQQGTQLAASAGEGAVKRGTGEGWTIKALK